MHTDYSRRCRWCGGCGERKRERERAREREGEGGCHCRNRNVEHPDPPFRDSTKTIVKLMSHANGLRGTALSHLRLSQIDKRFFNIGISRFRDNFLLISCHSFFPLRKNVNLSCLYLCDIALDLQSE